LGIRASICVQWAASSARRLATVGAQLRSGLPLEDLFTRQVDPAHQAREIAPSMPQLMALVGAFRSCAEIADPIEKRQRLGRIALDSETVSEAERRVVVASRLPAHHWPTARLELAVVDAESGAFHLFDNDCGVALVDAVAASCAAPGVWPPVSIAGNRYVDGGLRSADNADLAAGDGHVVILSPIGGVALDGGTSSLATEFAALEAAGTKTIAIQPDAQSRSAIGVNPLDPSTRAAVAQAGREQGRSLASDLGAWLAEPNG
jgi:NTE family protein